MYFSIDDFNARVKVAVSQQGQDWEVPQIKDLNLVMTEHYSFMSCNTFFLALGILGKYLTKFNSTLKSTLHPGSYRASFDTSLTPKSLSLHCKQINRIKNKVDGQPSTLLTCIKILILKHLLL